MTTAQQIESIQSCRMEITCERKRSSTWTKPGTVDWWLRDLRCKSRFRFCLKFPMEANFQENCKQKNRFRHWKECTSTSQSGMHPTHNNVFHECWPRHDDDEEEDCGNNIKQWEQSSREYWKGGMNSVRSVLLSHTLPPTINHLHRYLQSELFFPNRQ